MTDATSFHKSNFGSFGNNLPCDLNGYVHLTTEDWMSAPLDWGTEEMDTEDKIERCSELAQQARDATSEAEIALEDWRKENA